ncbi:unnamed protein product [Tilletia controversa]|uniref:Uncharacterized protein n=2 Tax=Tilletia TaxID=13289 RepID=A0A177TB57_9BASI|nr:hypothetical protein CF335_g8937 [Tilletia laevis]KAE8254397.1 hypothetical protein A4X03_0g5720 [Tilletia caries]CAD6924738.1 unnamed protein product [Tilletia controversa]KAE8183587.1 hypothetical protein CF336_g8118 [Tilletia laevis]CAD6890410.1 unnamed protein product [Tilletia caries]
MDFFQRFGPSFAAAQRQARDTAPTAAAPISSQQALTELVFSFAAPVAGALGDMLARRINPQLSEERAATAAATREALRARREQEGSFFPHSTSAPSSAPPSPQKRTHHTAFNPPAEVPLHKRKCPGQAEAIPLLVTAYHQLVRIRPGERFTRSQVLGQALVGGALSNDTTVDNPFF